MIEVNNLTTVRVDEKQLKDISQKVLRGEKIKDEVELSIALVGPARMREINKRYLSKNRATDVLAFPAFAKGYGGQANPFKGIQGLGEIVICPIEVKKNAKEFSSTFEKELIKVLIHGILHLLGYNHENSRKESKKMEKKQNYYFSPALKL